LIINTPQFREFKGKMNDYENYSHSLAQNFSFNDRKNNFKCILSPEFEGNSIDCDQVLESVESYYLIKRNGSERDWKCFEMSYNCQKLKSHRIKQSLSHP
jgi:hypothetical protein